LKSLVSDHQSCIDVAPDLFNAQKNVPLEFEYQASSTKETMQMDDADLAEITDRDEGGDPLLPAKDEDVFFVNLVEKAVTPRPASPVPVERRTSRRTALSDAVPPMDAAASPPRVNEVQAVDTPYTHVTKVAAGSASPEDRLNRVGLTDCRVFACTPGTVTEAIKNSRNRKRVLPMRKHGFGNGSVCRGIEKRFESCTSLLTSQKLTGAAWHHELLGILEALRESTLAGLISMSRKYDEDQLTDFLRLTISLLGAAIEADIDVYDIRKVPYLYIKEFDYFYCGYGDLLVVMFYTLTPEDGRPNKKIMIAAIAIEVKKDALSWGAQVGQTAGQVLHFNGRHAQHRMYVVESIGNKAPRHCYGLLTNSFVSTGLTYVGSGNRIMVDTAGEQQHEQLFLLELTKSNFYTHIYTLLRRSMEMRDLTLKGVTVVIEQTASESDSGADGDSNRPHQRSSDDSDGEPKDPSGDEDPQQGPDGSQGASDTFKLNTACIGVDVSQRPRLGHISNGVRRGYSGYVPITEDDADAVIFSPLLSPAVPEKGLRFGAWLNSMR